MWTKHETQTANKTNTVEENINSNNTNNPAPVNDSHVDVHTLDTSIVNKVRSEVEGVMTTVKIRVQDPILTARESFIVPRLELAM